MFATEQGGRIRVFSNNAKASEAPVFLDIGDKVSTRGDEECPLGLAFDPAFGGDGRFYVYYSGSNLRRSVLSSFTIDSKDPNRADPASERVILEIKQPAGNHNGGHVFRGQRLLSLVGAYIYADFCSGKIWGFGTTVQW